jgi:hypothetical protein
MSAISIMVITSKSKASTLVVGRAPTLLNFESPRLQAAAQSRCTSALQTALFLVLVLSRVLGDGKRGPQCPVLSVAQREFRICTSSIPALALGICSMSTSGGSARATIEYLDQPPPER